MVSINAMYAMNSGFVVHYPPRRNKVPRACGQSERVTEGNLDVGKREIEAEGRDFH